MLPWPPNLSEASFLICRWDNRTCLQPFIYESPNPKALKKWKSFLTHLVAERNLWHIYYLDYPSRCEYAYFTAAQSVPLIMGCWARSQSGERQYMGIYACVRVPKATPWLARRTHGSNLLYSTVSKGFREQILWKTRSSPSTIPLISQQWVVTAYMKCCQAGKHGWDPTPSGFSGCWSHR